MPDDNPAPSASSKANEAVSSNGNGLSSGINPSPAIHGLRRSRTTIEDVSSSRRRTGTPTGRFSNDANPSLPPRRSSNFSEYSFTEAKDLLNPQGRPRENHDSSTPETSSLAGLSLAFALLPAISGVLFNNGHAVVTDIMLLGLGGVFLHWSVTQPWIWYHAAQQVRVQQEESNDVAVDDDSDYDTGDGDLGASGSLEDVPEEGGSPSKTDAPIREKMVTPEQQSALSELYIHEALALISCFVLPLVGAYLLHAIRSQLSRPSEGLVSNYNLTIFLLVAELRTLSHMIKLVQARTLHLQRVVHENPYSFGASSTTQVVDLLRRVQLLEGRSPLPGPKHGGEAEPEQGVNITKDVRAAIQPELDALNRAMRRYEKRSTLLQHQTDARFAGVEARLDDAIALAAAAVKNSSSNNSLILRLFDSILAFIIFPFNLAAQILSLPLRPITALFQSKASKNSSASYANGRGKRSTGKILVPARYGGDRMPTRPSKR